MLLCSPNCSKSHLKIGLPFIGLLDPILICGGHVSHTTNNMVHTEAQHLDTSWVSYNLSQFWHYLLGIASDSTGKGLSHARLSPPLLQISVRSPGCYLYSWLMSYKSEGPLTPSLGLIDFLEWLPEFKETFYLLEYWFIIEGYNSKTAIWKRCIEQGMGKGCGASIPSQCIHFPQIFMCSPPKSNLNPVLLGFFCGGFITQAWLIKSLTIAYWTPYPSSTLP